VKQTVVQEMQVPVEEGQLQVTTSRMQCYVQSYMQEDQPEVYNICIIINEHKMSDNSRDNNNIDRLRWCFGTFDWTPVLDCESVAIMYNWFLQIVCNFISVCGQVKMVTLGPCDPDFVTPLVKRLLAKRRKLRKQGRKEAADELAGKINNLNCEFRKKRLAHLADARP